MMPLPLRQTMGTRGTLDPLRSTAIPYQCSQVEATVAAARITTMARRRKALIHSRRCCLVGVTFFSVWSGPAVVSAFGSAGSSLGRTLASAAAIGGEASRTRGIRRPRTQAPPQSFLIPATSRPGPFVGDGPPSTTKDWRYLGAEEENALCEQILENRRVQDLQVELERTESRPVTVHEWAVAAGHPSAHQLMAALQEGRRAERTMALCHQGLVRSVAMRYEKVSQCLTLDDLIQEGNVGLLEAVGHFDPTKGARFSSYAVFRIKGSILRAISNKDRLVRVPVHAQDAAMRILAASHSLELETGSVPTDEQLSLALSIPLASVSLYRRSAVRDSEEFSDSKDWGEGRIRGQQWPWEPSQPAMAMEFREDLLRVMQACLSPTEERVLRLRFGLGVTGKERGRGGGLTFKEIGRMMELSGEGIRKMVFRSIAKLQESDEANGLLLAYADLA